MWSLVPRGTQLLIVVALGVIATSVAAGLSKLLTGTARPDILYVSAVATAITLVIIPAVQACWRPIWRLAPRLNDLLFPDLNGTWTGEATPAGEGGTTGEALPVTVWIRQDLFKVTVTLQTDQASSTSVRSSVEADRAVGRFRPRHEGAACLEVHTEGGRDKLNGHYFTDRGTKGRLSLTRRSTQMKAAR